MAEEEQIKPDIDNGDGGVPEQVQQQHEEPRNDVDSNAPPRDDVCRDFLKNICNRGSRCKFYHPPESKARVEEHINFCIDFQVRIAAIMPFLFSFGYLGF